MGHLQEAKNLPEFSPAQKLALALVFWEWYEAHKDDTIIKRKVIIFSLTIKVKDLRELFVMLFGNPPAEFVETGR